MLERRLAAAARGPGARRLRRLPPLPPLRRRAGAGRARGGGRGAHHQRDLLLPRAPPAARPSARSSCPLLRQGTRARSRLRIWTAGCSTGRGGLHHRDADAREPACFDGWDVEIFGTDISRKVLAAARRGDLRRLVVRASPAASWCERYFDPAGRAPQGASEEVRSLVSLRPPEPARRARWWRAGAARGRDLLPQRDDLLRPAARRQRVLEGFHEQARRRAATCCSATPRA